MLDWWVAAGAVAVILLGLLSWLLRRRGEVSPDQARREFLQQREHLEAAFLDRAAAGGKPRGLRWVGLDWGPHLEMARDRRTNDLALLAEVTIRFEAIPGSDMEGLPAVANLRTGSALFIHDGRRWHATGRVVFNLPPTEALARFAEQFERLEPAGVPPAADTH